MFNPFKKAYGKKEKEKFEFLLKIKLFEKLVYDELDAFLPFLYQRTYKKEEAVFFRNDPSQALYILKSGKVSLNLNREDQFETLATISDGEAFGDNSLLKDTKRIYNAIVVSETAEILVVPQGNIFNIFDAKPKIKAKMLESLAEQYNRYTLNLFKAYKSSFGFFELYQAYVDEEEGE